MPTYEYECLACGHRFEKFQSMVDEPLKKCPDCGQKVKRLIGTGSGIIFKAESARSSGHGAGGGTACSLESTGRTCCGRTSRCDAPNCGR